ncbi:hypothetical protein GCM10009116_08890 [Brevundimonas basaltis]
MAKIAEASTIQRRVVWAPSGRMIEDMWAPASVAVQDSTRRARPWFTVPESARRPPGSLAKEDAMTVMAAGSNAPSPIHKTR